MVTTVAVAHQPLLIPSFTWKVGVAVWEDGTIVLASKAVVECRVQTTGRVVQS